MTSHFCRSLRDVTTGPQTFQSNFRLLEEDLDSIINKGDSFTVKKHDLTTVGVLDGHIFGFGHDLLIKRFNYRGLLDFAVRRIFSGRAERLWNISQRLFADGLPVPQPLGYVEPSRWRKNSFFISSVIENSLNLADVYKQGLFSEPQRLAAILAGTLSAWHMAGAVHGDLKWSNILMQKNGDVISFFLVDLDSAKLYARPEVKGIRKDLIRFYRYGLELGAEEWVRTEFLPAYREKLAGHIKDKIDLLDLGTRARKDWERKRRRRR